jgi:hypothetical protein
MKSEGSPATYDKLLSFSEAITSRSPLLDRNAVVFCLALFLNVSIGSFCCWILPRSGSYFPMIAVTLQVAQAENRSATRAVG